MPEGDTIHKAAARLRPALEGAAVVRFEAPRLAGPYRPRVGMVVESVEARGKHLLVHFDAGVVLQVHLGMTGSWHLYRPGDRWRKPAHLARVVLGVEGWEAVCFSAPTVRAWAEPAGGRVDSTPVGHLGPDLCRPDADVDDALARMAHIPEPGTTVAEVLLDQRVAAGIGNVYKSEVLFACRLDPFTPIEAVPVDVRRRLLETAARQLRANLDRPGRETVPGGLAVYGRARQPCLRCGTPLRSRRHGAQARTTTWCPSCQG